MPIVALGAAELRIKDSSGAYRVFCFRKSVAGIFVFHAFVKKTEKTQRQEIEVAQKRLGEMLRWQSQKS